MEVDGVTSFQSILDKPLHQLTEDDISQLTREDCRKYLKDKGMRRPSWNKSQAIQQVISLKALLEPTEDSAAGALKRILISSPANTPRATLTPNSVGAGPQIADETVAYRRKDPPKSTPPLESEADDKAISPRRSGATNGSDRQMTIFYCGKVNVYDGVPPDKAQAVMHVAESPIRLPQDNLPSGTAALWSSQCHLQTTRDKHGLNPSAPISQTMQTEKMTEYPKQYREKGNITHDADAEGQASRKVSLQRYLEKRKDRGRFKGRKSTGFSSSSLEVYVNQQLKTHTLNGQSSRSSTSSPPQPALPHALCSSADKKTKIASFSVDLNEDVQEN